MSKFRDRYFEDYVAQPYTTPDGKVKVEYVYRGNWIQWGVEGSANRRKLLYGLLEAVSIIIFFFASTREVKFNALKSVAGFGVASYVPWILEVWGVVRFCIGKTFITEFDYKTIDWQITVGCLIRIALLLIAAICGAVSSIGSGGMDMATVFVAAGLLVSAALSAVIFRLQRKIGYRSYKIINGKPGPEN